MWGWLAMLGLYGASRPKADEAGRRLVVALFLLAWLVLGIIEVAAAVWPW